MPWRYAEPSIESKTPSVWAGWDGCPQYAFAPASAAYRRLQLRIPYAARGSACWRRWPWRRGHVTREGACEETYQEDVALCARCNLI